MKTSAHNIILTKLNDLEDQDVAGLREPLEKLEGSPGWKIVTEQLDDEIERTRNQMEWGGVLDHHEYTSQTGKIRGLQQARVIVEATIEGAKRAESRILDRERTIGAQTALRGTS